MQSRNKEKTAWLGSSRCLGENRPAYKYMWMFPEGGAREMRLTKEVGLHFALGFCEGVCEHLGLDGQVLYLEHAHEALDAVAAKHAEEAAPAQQSSTS